MKVVNKVVQIPIYDIVPNKNQPRKSFDTASLMPLALSIKENGILQPLTVRKSDTTGKFELVAGERRLRAAKMVYYSAVPCIIIDINDEKSAILALIENLQRENLNFFEEAKAIENLISQGISQSDIAKSLGKAQSTIANKIRILKLTQVEISSLLSNNLTERHARALLKIDDVNLRKKVIQEIINKQLNVAQTEKLVENCLITRTGKPKEIFYVKDVRLFFNTINKAIDVMKKSGIEAQALKTEFDEYIEYQIKIPLKKPAKSKVKSKTA